MKRPTTVEREEQAGDVLRPGDIEEMADAIRSRPNRVHTPDWVNFNVWRTAMGCADERQGSTGPSPTFLDEWEQAVVNLKRVLEGAMVHGRVEYCGECGMGNGHREGCQRRWAPPHP